MKILKKQYQFSIFLIFFLSLCLMVPSAWSRIIEGGEYLLVDGVWTLQPEKEWRTSSIKPVEPKDFDVQEEPAAENIVVPPEVVEFFPLEQNIVQPPENPEEVVDLLADEMSYDQVNQLVSAIGNVELLQAGRTLYADKITYDLNADNVQATGNIVLKEEMGDVYYAQSVELQDKMKDGFVRGLSGALADGSRFTAESAEKIADLKLIMNKATYTACEPCKADPSRAPAWQIKARNVTHHKDEARVSYNNATLEVVGVPVMYSPYFSHPDGSMDRKSGFLIPTVSFDSDLGASYDQEYYWNIAPDKDATIGVRAFLSEAPLVTTEYRQRFNDAIVTVQAGGTYSERTDSVAGNDVFVPKEERGHLFIEGLWNINDKWRAGTDLKFVSDEQYLDQYDFSNEDILQRTAYLERFDGRDYVNARLIDLEDLRTSDRQDDQPNILPEVYANFKGDPNQTLGGRWELETSLLGLRRSGDEQDMNRATSKLGWQRRYIAPIGLVNRIDLSLRGDIYQVNDSDNGNDSSGELRGFSQAHIESSYPVAKSFDKGKLVLEPMVSLNLGSNLNDTNDIPNEDSQDVFLDSTNIFNANRFPGYDRIEDETSTTYGVRTGLYRDNGYKGELFLGQSHRFDDNDNPFPKGSGLSKEKSDIVGNVSIAAGSALQLNYGMQLESDSLSSQRHEVDLTGAIGRVNFNTRYFYAAALEGTDLDESREQIQFGTRYRLTDKLSLLGSTQYDLAENTQGLRRVKYGLDYQGQCVNFLVSGQRKLTSDSSGDSGAEFMVRLGLKNLGEFETSSFSIGSEN